MTLTPGKKIRFGTEANRHADKEIFNEIFFSGVLKNKMYDIIKKMPELQTPNPETFQARDWNAQHQLTQLA
jgi:hypothetical protein